MEKGGVTVQVTTGHRPRTGYMVSREGHETEIPAQEFGPHHLSGYRQQHRRHLAEAGVYLGTWHDKKRGVVDIDESERVKDWHSAQLVGAQNHQRAVYDLVMDKARSLQVPGVIGQVKASPRALRQARGKRD